MLVQAKWQIAYKGVLYVAGTDFDLDDADYESYKNDVRVYSRAAEPTLEKKVVMATRRLKRARNKRLKKEKNK